MDISYSHILATSPHEYFQSRYYVILAHLSTYFNDSILIDLGTNKGESAAALSYNKSNIVYTYDIFPNDEAIQRVQEEGNIVEVISGPFKGEKARVQRIDQAKEEVTVELFEAMVPIPITVRGDHVRVLEKEVN